MPASLTLDAHAEAVAAAGARLLRLAEAAGLDTAVPTCPSWDVRALVAHQAMVHRWATAHVTGGDPDAEPNQTEIAGEQDLPGFFRTGVDRLVAALRAAPGDLKAMRFLNDAPPPREFWARRQAHETTIHMTDALAASLGRPPRTEDADLDPDLAVDGLDELLRGFFTRGTSKLYDGTAYTVAVTPTDATTRWTLHVDEQLTVDPPGAPTPRPPDVEVSGTAVGLYLALWNRGGDVEVSGDEQFLDRWRAVQHVRWR